MRTRVLPRPSSKIPAASNPSTLPDLPGRGRIHGAIVHRTGRIDRLSLGKFDVPLSTSKELIESNNFRLLQIASKQFEAANSVWNRFTLFTRQLRE